jgi:hypothetical protein
MENGETLTKGVHKPDWSSVPGGLAANPQAQLLSLCGQKLSRTGLGKEWSNNLDDVTCPDCERTNR